MKTRSYSKGTLLWIDDDLSLHGNLQQGGDVDVWRHVFGDTESRIYRLFNLQLVIATSYNDAKQIIDDFLLPENINNFIVTLVDITIPKNYDGQPSEKYGIELANYLTKNNMVFYFLSSKADVFEQLKKEGLESVPYFRKQFTGVGKIIPEELTHTILNEFRSHISLIDLSKNISILKKNNSEFPDNIINPDTGEIIEPKLEGFASKYFPFMGSFRDFVERWEYKPFVKRDNLIIVLRAPLSHCNAFIYQCLIILFSHYIKKGRVILNYVDARNENLLRRFNASRDEILAFRIYPKTINPETVRNVVNNTSHFGGVRVFIIPNDDTSDLYYDVLPKHQDVVYDDLPLIRVGDKLAREETVKKLCKFVFQKWRLKLDNNEEKYFGDFYLEHPEVAINPINWISILEEKNISYNISDPFEILDIFDKATKTFKSNEKDGLDFDVIESLANNKPLNYSKLLRVADDIIIKQESYNLLKKNAFKYWLKTSWHIPYGVTDKVGYAYQLNEISENQWEDFCLKVACELSKEFDYSDSFDFRESVKLLEARKFLNAKIIQKIIKNEPINNIDGIEFLRWPHTHYPMPSSLTKRLSKQKRHFFAQSEYINTADTLAFTRRQWHIFKNTVEDYSVRIEWFKNISSSLPEGWKEPVNYLLMLVNARDEQKKAIDKPKMLWEAILSLAKNATPVSIIYHYLISNKILPETHQKLKKELEEVHGAGKMLGMIRGHRAFSKLNCLKPTPSYLRSLTHELSRINGYKDLLLYYGELNQSEKYDYNKRLNDLFFLIKEIIINIDTGVQSRVLGNNHLHDICLLLNNLQIESEWYISYDKKNQADTKLYLDLCKKLKKSKLSFAEIPSLLTTKGDYLFSSLELLQHIYYAILPFRFYDGYHFLAMVTDLRNASKDLVYSPPDYIMDEILQMFFLSVEGLVAQLKFCLEVAGYPQAKAIKLNNVTIEKPEGFYQTPKMILDKFFILREKNIQNSYELFTLGLPGKASELCYCKNNVLVKYE